MDKPLVTVICLCYNQAAYVEEAIRSALGQTWPAVQLIVVDDASRDNSVEIIEKLVRNRPDIHFIAHKSNLGNCKSFNEAFAFAKGEYVIDLAADDVLMPGRIEKGVEAFLRLPAAGATFSDAEYIDAQSAAVGRHYKRDRKGRLVDRPPEGDVYQAVLEKYFICPPSVMFRRETVERLGGYDERLAYEDFDFFVRSARLFPYVFTDEALVKKRILKNSLSAAQYAPGSDILESTYVVCRKAFELNRTAAEHKALAKRIKYETRQALLSGNHAVAESFLDLLGEIEKGWQRRVLKWLARNRVNVSFLNHLRLSSSSSMLK